VTQGPTTRNHITRFPLVEDVAFTVVSAVIVVLAITVIFMPPVMSLAANVERTAQPTDRFIDFYGVLTDADGNPIHGAEIEIYDSDGTRVSFYKTKIDGFFDFHFNDGPDTYTIVVTVTIDRVEYSESIELWMEPGYTYGVDLTFTETNTIIIVPLPVY